MAPLSKSLHTACLVFTHEGTKVYQGSVDDSWAVGAVPHGGYTLALVIEACIQSQASAAHADPIHVTAHYLQSTSLGVYEVHVRTLKAGKSFTNITAELVQEGRTRITSHLIFGIIAPSPTDPPPLVSIAPPSPYARRLPLNNHPATAALTPIPGKLSFNSQIRWAEDPTLLSQNSPDSPLRTHSASVGGGGTVWGAWLEFAGEEKTYASTLAFLADMMINLPILLPRSERPDLGPSWLPTMTMSLEFKSRIPPPSQYHAKRTFGLYSTGHFLNHPHGRHNAYVEIWSAPCDLGQGDGDTSDGWRDRQVCLAVATQMALTIPMEVNLRKSQQKGGRL